MTGSGKRNQTPKHGVNAAEGLKKGPAALLCSLGGLDICEASEQSSIISTTKTLLLSLLCMREWDGW